MTKERAIDLCQAIDKYLCAGNPIWDVEEIHDAMSTAIEALSAETKGDLISREQAIAIATQEGAYDYISAQELAKLPSAEPDWDEMVVICDCCGHAISVKRERMVGEEE